MPIVRVDLDIGGLFAGAQHRGHRFLVLFGRIEPIAAEGHHQGLGLHRREGSIQRFRAVGEVEIVQGLRQIEVCVGVESIDEALALVAQVALHLELDVEGKIKPVLPLRRRPNFWTIPVSDR